MRTWGSPGQPGPGEGLSAWLAAGSGRMPDRDSPGSASAAARTRRLRLIPPASGALVMATGIVSIALSSDREETASRVLLALTAAAWLALGVLLAGRALFDRAQAVRDARSPAALTGVAATAVLGARLSQLGWSTRRRIQGLHQSRDALAGTAGQ
jgi:hypothetical protein